MRIVAGKQKGTRLETPEGRDTRPTSDRARENLFNILAHGAYAETLRGATVLELFAGTGALGLEALSRGAAFCHFVENGKAAQRVLRANIKKCHAEDRSSLSPMDAFHLPAQQHPFDMIFIDPPYRSGAVEQAISSAITAGAIGVETMIIGQLDPKTPFSTPEGLTLLDDRRYGAARFLFLEKAA